MFYSFTDLFFVFCSYDTPLKRKSRVWTDENFACILRHCKQHKPGSNSYLSCLSENCRRGVLAVARDLEQQAEQFNRYHQQEDQSRQNEDVGIQSYVPQDLVNSNDLVESERAEISDYIGACYNKYCSSELSYQDAITCVMQHCDTPVDQNIEDWQNKLSTSSKRRLESLMADLETLYSQEESRKHPPKFVRNGGQSRSNSIEDDSVESLERQNVRKRRVNDEVSQCIQSYCGSDAPVDRVFCIVKHCHRSRSVYK